MIVIEYRLESDLMSDDQYNNQDELEFIITKEMIIELIESNVNIAKGYEVCETNIYIK